MRRTEKTGETWTIYGKEITPVIDVYSNSTGKGENTGGFGYAWAYIRPVHFVIREGGEERRVNIPAVDRIALFMTLWIIMLPFLVYAGKKLISR